MSLGLISEGPKRISKGFTYETDEIGSSYESMDLSNSVLCDEELGSDPSIVSYLKNESFLSSPTKKAMDSINIGSFFNAKDELRCDQGLGDKLNGNDRVVVTMIIVTNSTPRSCNRASEIFEQAMVKSSVSLTVVKDPSSPTTSLH